MINNNKEEDPNQYHFDLPRFIIRMFLWTARFLMCLKVFNSGEPILNIGLMIALYFLMEICISFLLGFIRYFPQMMKNPERFINMSQDNIKELLDNDLDFINSQNGIITILYLFLYFH